MTSSPFAPLMVWLQRGASHLRGCLCPKNLARACGATFANMQASDWPCCQFDRHRKMAPNLGRHPPPSTVPKMPRSAGKRSKNCSPCMPTSMSPSPQASDPICSYLTLTVRRAARLLPNSRKSWASSRKRGPVEPAVAGCTSSSSGPRTLCLLGILSAKFLAPNSMFSATDHMRSCRRHAITVARRTAGSARESKVT
jgi:hypothetical protein